MREINIIIENVIGQNATNQLKKKFLKLKFNGKHFEQEIKVLM